MPSYVCKRNITAESAQSQLLLHYWQQDWSTATERGLLTQSNSTKC